jgi:hypothetical protein
MKIKSAFSAAILTAILYICGNLLAGTYSGGNGSAGNPYQIAIKEDLLSLAAEVNDYNKCFILTADINMAGQVFTQSVVAPDINSNILSFQGTMFSGNFNGNGHVVHNLTIHASGNDFIGLFGCVGPDGQIRNLGVKNVNIIGLFAVGALAGYSGHDSISNCYSTGSVRGSSGSYYIGALVGYSEYSSIRDCYSTVNILDGSDCVGGLVGYNWSGSISNCYSTGNVTCSGGSQNIGGLAGENLYGSITYCYSTGSVSGNSNVGGLIGFSDSGDANNSFWDVNSSGQSASAGGTGKTTAQMKTRSTFTSAGWDFVGKTVNGTIDIWRMCVDEVDYPHLTWEYARRGDFVCPDGMDIYDLKILSGQWLFESYDSNRDGIINFLDFAVFAKHWQGDMNQLFEFSSQWLGLPKNPLADLNGDGIVNLQDFAIFAQHWLE